MFLGHFGVGLAAKPLQPRVSLGTMFLAAQLADLLWPTLLLLGVERVACCGATGAGRCWWACWCPVTGCSTL